jgi:hypothetical protein
MVVTGWSVIVLLSALTCCIARRGAMTMMTGRNQKMAVPGGEICCKIDRQIDR